MLNAKSHCGITRVTISDSINGSDTSNCKKRNTGSPIYLISDLWPTDCFSYLKHGWIWASSWVKSM